MKKPTDFKKFDSLKNTTLKERTTSEQWELYKEELASHRQHVINYKWYLDKICRHLQFVQNSKAWTTPEIMDVMMKEIAKVESMDAPNEPGYYRANND